MSTAPFFSLILQKSRILFKCKVLIWRKNQHFITTTHSSLHLFLQILLLDYQGCKEQQSLPIKHLIFLRWENQGLEKKSHSCIVEKPELKPRSFNSNTDTFCFPALLNIEHLVDVCSQILLFLIYISEGGGKCYPGQNCCTWTRPGSLLETLVSWLQAAQPCISDIFESGEGEMS